MEHQLLRTIPMYYHYAGRPQSNIPFNDTNTINYHPTHSPNISPSVLFLLTAIVICCITNVCATDSSCTIYISSLHGSDTAGNGLSPDFPLASMSHLPSLLSSSASSTICFDTRVGNAYANETVAISFLHPSPPSATLVFQPNPAWSNDPILCQYCNITYNGSHSITFHNFIFSSHVFLSIVLSSSTSTDQPLQFTFSSCQFVSLVAYLSFDGFLIDSVITVGTPENEGSTIRMIDSQFLHNNGSLSMLFISSNITFVNTMWYNNTFFPPPATASFAYASPFIELRAFNITLTNVSYISNSFQYPADCTCEICGAVYTRSPICDDSEIAYSVTISDSEFRYNSLTGGSGPIMMQLDSCADFNGQSNDQLVIDRTIFHDNRFMSSLSSSPGGQTVVHNGLLQSRIRRLRRTNTYESCNVVFTSDQQTMYERVMSWDYYQLNEQIESPVQPILFNNLFNTSCPSRWIATARHSNA